MVRVTGGVLATIGAVSTVVALVLLDWLSPLEAGRSTLGWSGTVEALGRALPAPASGSSELADLPLTIIDPAVACIAGLVLLPAVTCAVRSRRICRVLAVWHATVALVALVGIVVSQQGFGPAGTTGLVLVVTLALVALLHLCLVFLQLDASGRYLHPVLALIAVGGSGALTYALVEVGRDQAAWSLSAGGWLCVGGLAAVGLGYVLAIGPGPDDDTGVVRDESRQGLWEAAAGPGPPRSESDVPRGDEPQGAVPWEDGPGSKLRGPPVRHSQAPLELQTPELRDS